MTDNRITFLINICIFTIMTCILMWCEILLYTVHCFTVSCPLFPLIACFLMYDTLWKSSLYSSSMAANQVLVRICKKRGRKKKDKTAVIYQFKQSNALHLL